VEGKRIGKGKAEDTARRREKEEGRGGREGIKLDLRFQTTSAVFDMYSI
jgi:hypothetical protein